MMMVPHRVAGLLVVVLLLAGSAPATTVMSPPDPGVLAADSGGVFLGRALTSRVVWRGHVLYTVTSFQVTEWVKGRGPTRVEVAVPGGERDGVGLAVAGAPRFTPGQDYLLFADAVRDGSWQPRLMADSVLRKARDTEGVPILVPVPEAGSLSRLAPHGGPGAPVLGPVYEGRFLAQLQEVMAGKATWQPAAVMVPAERLGGRTKEWSPPSPNDGCVFLTHSDGMPIRWRRFDSGGSVGMAADDTPDAQLPSGGYAEVQGALANWDGVGGTSLDLFYAGTKDVGTSWCSEEDQDYPGVGSDVVVFNDPCDDIPDLHSCAGTLAYGGPYFSLSLHTFAGQSWHEIQSWFVVVNDGVGGCPVNYELLLTHELGHGLGFDHSADSSSVMWPYCCRPLDDLDRACLQYVYPAPGGALPTPTRTPTRTATPTPTPRWITPTPTPTPTRAATWTATPMPETITVPVVAHVEGVGGAPWRSDLAVANPGPAALTVRLGYQPSADTVLARSYRLAPLETRLLEDLVRTEFGAGDGRGPIRVEPQTSGAAPPVVVSRTFAQREFGNLGQGMPALSGSMAGTFYLPGLRHDAAFRSNVSVTAAAGSAVTATFRLYRGEDGRLGLVAERAVGAGEQKQWSVDQLFPGAAEPGTPMTVAVSLSAPGVAFASMADNTSTDAVTYLGQRPAPEWLVPVIAHNPGLDGTFWSSSLTLANVGMGSASIALEMLPESSDNSRGGILVPAFRLAAGRTIELDDVALRTFGVHDGKGALVVRSTEPVVVSSRVFTARAEGGTIGHGVQAVDADDLSPRPRLLPGVRMAGGFRSNLGIVSGGAAVRARVRLLDHDGVELADAVVDVPPRSLRQWSMDALFGSVVQPPRPVGSLVVEGDADLVAYLVVIDGSSQDPVFLLP